MEHSSIWDPIEGKLTELVESIPTIEIVPDTEVREKPVEGLSVSVVTGLEDKLLLKSTTDTVTPFRDFFQSIPQSLLNVLSVRPVVDDRGDVFVQVQYIAQCFEPNKDSDPPGTVQSLSNSQTTPTATRFLPKLSTEKKIAQFTMMAESIKYYNTELMEVDRDCRMEVCDRDSNGFSALISKELFPVKYKRMSLLLPTDFPLSAYISSISQETEDCLHVDFNCLGLDQSTSSSAIESAYKLSDKYNSVDTKIFDLTYYCNECSRNSRMPLRSGTTMFLSCVDCGETISLDTEEVKSAVMNDDTAFPELVTILPQMASKFDIDNLKLRSEPATQTSYKQQIEDKTFYVDFTNEETDDSEEQILVYEYQNSIIREHIVSEILDAETGPPPFLSICGNCATHIRSVDESSEVYPKGFIYNGQGRRIIPQDKSLSYCSACLDELQETIQSVVNAHPEAVLSHKI